MIFSPSDQKAASSNKDKSWIENKNATTARCVAHCGQTHRSQRSGSIAATAWPMVIVSDKQRPTGKFTLPEWNLHRQRGMEVPACADAYDDEEEVLRRNRVQHGQARKVVEVQHVRACAFKVVIADIVGQRCSTRRQVFVIKNMAADAAARAYHAASQAHRSNNLPSAILWYEKALSLTPRDAPS